MNELATFGAGCFWGVEEAFNKLNGVVKTEVGYAGGATPQPTYEQVCSQRTGHAEVVQVTYDPNIISYDDLLAVFWQSHDPTSVNRQGPDVGSSYRSVIFCHSEEQKNKAIDSKKQLQSKMAATIATQILPAPAFYKAEEYHQRYIEKHRD